MTTFIPWKQGQYVLGDKELAVLMAKYPTYDETDIAIKITLYIVMPVDEVINRIMHR